MQNKNKAKIGIALIITFGMIFSTIPVVNAFDPIDHDPIFEVEHKINNVNLRSWVMDPFEGYYELNPNEPDNWAYKWYLPCKLIP